MPIKRRLFLYCLVSNLLLVTICLLTIFSGKFFLFGLREDGQFLEINGPGVFKGLMEEGGKLAKRWEKHRDLATMLAEADDFNRRLSGRRLGLLVYQDGRRLNGASAPDIDPWVLDAALSRPGAHMMGLDRTAVYSMPVGPYRVLVTDGDFWMGGPFSEEKALGRYILTCVLAFGGGAFLISLFLVTFVARHVIRALDSLSEGAHQIRDGNLDYRIEPNRCHPLELTRVCDDFNEMAGRLSDAVKKKQRDEKSRKELIAGISHDLRTPLTSIKAYAEGLLGGVAGTPEKREKYLKTIKLKAEDMEKIIRQLFLFSKLDVRTFPMNIERLEAHKELDGFVSGLADHYAELGLSISFTAEGPPAHIEADAALLRSALTNVIENSLKYKDKERGHLEVRSRAADGQVVITLADDGPGVSEEARAKLFEIFYRCDEARSDTSQGSGLGLGIAAKIVQQLGGAIAAEASPSGGLSIIMTFPQTGDAA